MEHNYSLVLKGTNFSHTPYAITLGPFRERSQAEDFSNFLTDNRIGEQLLTKLGVERVILVDNG